MMRWDLVKEERRLLGDEEDVYGGRIDLVEVGQRRHAGVGRVDAAVELAAVHHQQQQHNEEPNDAADRCLQGKGELTRTVRPLKVMWTQERPTSLPAPRGVMIIWSPSRPLEAGRFPGSEALGAAATDAMVVRRRAREIFFFFFSFFLLNLPLRGGLGFCWWACSGAGRIFPGLSAQPRPIFQAGPWADVVTFLT